MLFVPFFTVAPAFTAVLIAATFAKSGVVVAFSSFGDSVSIGGKNYTIGAADADVDAWFTANGTDVTDAANKKVTINGTEYTYAAAVAKDTTAHTGAIAAGWYAKTPTAPNDENATTTLFFSPCKI